jgi:hypothetical protein
MECPAQTSRNGALVILTLEGISLGSEVEAKNFVVEIEQRDDCLKSACFGNPVADLRIDLCVRIEIRVAIRSLGIIRAVRPNVGVIVRQSHPGGDALLIVGHIEIPIVWSGTQQSGMVDAPEINRKCGLRGCVAIIRADSHTVQYTGQKFQRLLPTSTSKPVMCALGPLIGAFSVRPACGKPAGTTSLPRVAQNQNAHLIRRSYRFLLRAVLLSSTEETRSAGIASSFTLRTPSGDGRWIPLTVTLFNRGSVPRI